MTISNNNGKFELPEIMGFGELDQQSIIKTVEGVSAEYKSGDEVVFTVKWQPNKCILTEFYNGKILMETEDKDLEMAFLNLTLAWVPNQHPRFIKMVNEVIRLGNIHFTWPRMGNLIARFFPAGFIFDLRQPIIDSNRSVWSKIEEFVVQSEKDLPFKFYYKCPGAVFCQPENGNFIRTDVILVHLISPMFSLFDSVYLLKSVGLIPEEKEYRLDINVDLFWNSLDLYPGDPSRRIQYFATFEFGKGLGQIDEEKADKEFSRLYKGYLRSLKSGKLNKKTS